MKASTRLLGILAVTFGAATPAFADGRSDSLSELSAQWWQWALSIPTPSNPLPDSNGTNCMVGQRGPVWFLGGSTTGGTIRRTCAVPQGVSLFFPVINSVVFNTPNICGQVGSFTVKDMRGFAAPFIDAVTVATARLDNKPVKQIRRVRSEPFVTVLPPNNLFVDACAGDSPAGVFSPSVDDGYYVKLDGLDPGVHTLAFRAKSGTFELDVEYILHVAHVSWEVKN